MNGENDAPATKEDIEELARMVAKSQEHLATKDDLKQFATKDDLKQFATKEDLKQFATKEEFARILQIVESIDVQLKEWRDIPERLARVEERAFQP